MLFVGADLINEGKHGNFGVRLQSIENMDFLVQIKVKNPRKHRKTANYYFIYENVELINFLKFSRAVVLLNT